MQCFQLYDTSGGDIELVAFWGECHGHKCEHHSALDHAPTFCIIPVRQRQPGVLGPGANASAEACAWWQAGEATAAAAVAAEAVVAAAAAVEAAETAVPFKKAR